MSVFAELGLIMAQTSPRRTGEDHAVFSESFQLGFDDLKTIALKPSDLILHPVDFGIMLSAF